jgi:uncharacterized protein YneF (UPF0154 family)
MAEILIILWFSLICVLIAGFILGYFLGKVHATREYESHMPKTVQELQSIMDENDILTKENIELMKQLAEEQNK